MHPYRTKATRISIAASFTVLGALSFATLAHAQAAGDSSASADAQVQALKQELAEQRALINRLLDAQASQKAAIEKIESTPPSSLSPAATAELVKGSGTHTTVAFTPWSAMPEGFSLYGTFDVDVSSANSGYGHKTTVGSGGMSQSSLGFKANRKLGDTGLQAIGEIEMGLDLSTGVGGNGANVNGINTTFSSGSLLGNGSAMFARQAYGGLASATYGQLTLGRQYSGTYFSEVFGTAFGPGFYGSDLLFLPPIGGSPSRLSNSIVYKSPTFAGFSIQADWTAGAENNVRNAVLAGTTSQTDASGRGWDLTAFYRNGPAMANIATWHIKNTTFASGAGETGLATKSGWMLDGNYDFGIARLYATYMTGKISGGNYASVTQTVSKSDGWSISGGVPFGKHTVFLSYSTLNDKSLQNRDAQLYGIVYTYKLYQDTTLYANYAKLINKRDSAYSLMNGGDLVGSVSAPGFDPSGIMVGVNMRF